MRKDDGFRLRHMRDASREAVSFTKGKHRADLDDDRMLVFALVKAIEIVGEAANQISGGTRTHLPDIPLGGYCGDASPSDSRLVRYQSRYPLADRPT